MLNVRSDDIDGNIRQALELEKAGCEIVRVAVPDMQAVSLISTLNSNLTIPVVADIHFDYKLALESVAAGADKIRINPGNIGDSERVKAVAKSCKMAKIPIRIGVNSGSLDKDLLGKYGRPTAEALAESAERQIAELHRFDFTDIVLSIKSSSIHETVTAYRIIAEKTECPLHLGLTEAGTERMGVVKSAIAIGALLLDGIGETIRVSLSADPTKEIVAAKDILRALGLRGGVEIISCPTCGRTRVDIEKIANEIETAVADVNKDLKIAVMGCVVNGPGEAKEADLGVAGGESCAVIFKKGEIIKKVSETEIVPEILAEIKNL
jgi:(E)-4-hydroxy-3-methylbut-2-enyl-diphosphate synthase